MLGRVGMENCFHVVTVLVNDCERFRVPQIKFDVSHRTSFTSCSRSSRVSFSPGGISRSSRRESRRNCLVGRRFSCRPHILSQHREGSLDVLECSSLSALFFPVCPRGGRVGFVCLNVAVSFPHPSSIIRLFLYRVNISGFPAVSPLVGGSEKNFDVCLCGWMLPCGERVQVEQKCPSLGGDVLCSRR